MPEFSILYCTEEYNKNLTKNEIKKTIRFAIAAKYEAIQIYEDLSNSLENEIFFDLVCNIISDEKKHIEDFKQILKTI